MFLFLALLTGLVACSAIPSDPGRTSQRIDESRQVRVGWVSGTRQNRRADGPSGWRWQANMALLERDLSRIADWPADRLATVAPYPGAVLWVAGARSDYVRPEYTDAMQHWFPRTRKVVVKAAGHWVHSEQPEVFTEIVRRFCDD